MIKPLEQDFYVEDETGYTDEKIVEKVNEIIEALNAMLNERQKSEEGTV